MKEDIIEHEEVRVVSVRPVYTLDKSPTVAIVYRLKKNSMKIHPGNVITLIKNPARQEQGDGL